VVFPSVAALGQLFLVVGVFSGFALGVLKAYVLEVYWPSLFLLGFASAELGS